MVQIFIPDGQRPSVTLVYGKAFQITPSDPNQQVEVQRATDSAGTGATTFLSGVICQASGSIFVDQRANNGSSWFYRARHNSPGFDPGGWTDWVGGVVVLIPKAVLAAANNGTNLIIPPPYPATAFTQSGLTAFNQANIWNYDIVDTAWHTDSAVPGAWLQLDAASAKNMIECRIYALSAAYAGVYDIEYSDNASTWTATSTGFKPLALGLNVRRWASAGSHRYWRIKLTNTPGGGPWCSELHWIEAPSGGVLKPWIMPPVVYDGGNEKVHLTIDDTLTRFRPAVTESGSRAVNLLYAKPLVATVDTFDGIVDGTSFAKVAGVSSNKITDSSVAANVGLGLYDNGTQGASFTLNWNNGNIQKVTLSASGITITLSNPAAGRVYTIVFIQDGTGGRTIPTFSPAADYGDAGTPGWNTGASKKNVISFLYDGGTYLSVNTGTGF